ncbi:autotransporter domain-containing protein [Sutterella wadsworthensis]|uniref:autotransporter domain-containing protein n=1 Tax=Sutterella wadsworthensis TaxID=40545 RepID=UPI0013F5EBBF|nr:autotransporter domain-containing protein [Sutterella wadsworthensis]
MSSAQNASIFQSAWLAPFPRLTSIAAAVLTLLTAPVANASVIAAVKNAQGNDVMLFKLLSGAESGTGEDVSAADQGALLEAGAWLGELFGMPAAAPTVIAAADPFVSYASGSAWFDDNGRPAMALSWTEGLSSSQPSGGVYLGPAPGASYDYSPLAVLPSHALGSARISTILHELTHSAGMASIETGDYLGFECPNGWCHTAFTEKLTFNGKPIEAGSSLSGLVSFDSMPENLQTDLNKVRWYLGYSGIGFQGKNVREVIGENTVMYFPDEVTDSEEAVHEAISVTGAIPVLGAEMGNLDFSHLELQNSLLSHQSWRNWGTFMEAELAMLQDLGYQLDRKRFFGTSIYASGAEYTVGQAFWARNDREEWIKDQPSQQTNAVGVHVYGSRSKVTVAADQLADGAGSIGVRVDGSANQLSVNENVLISANGTGGIGMAFTYGRNHTLLLEGKVQALGSGGSALVFDFGGSILGDENQVRGSWTAGAATEYGWLTFHPKELNFPQVLQGSLIKSAVIAGTLQGSDAAIRIGPTAHVAQIRLVDGAHIEGDIVSSWSAVGTAEDFFDGYCSVILADSVNRAAAFVPLGTDVTTNLIFGGTEDGAAAQASDLEPFVYAGNVIGPWSIRMQAANGTDLRLQNTINQVVGMTVNRGAKLSGSAVFDFAGLNARVADVGGTLITGNAEIPNFQAGALVNAGTLVSTPSSGSIVILGDYVQSGKLVLGMRPSGELMPLSVSGTTEVKDGASLAVVPGGGWFEGELAKDPNPHGAVSTSGANTDASASLPEKAEWDLDLMTAKDFSPAVDFTYSAGVLKAAHQKNAYSKFLTSSAPSWQWGLAKQLDQAASQAPEVLHALYGDLDFSASDGSDIVRALGNLGNFSRDDSLRALFSWERLLNRQLFAHHETTQEGERQVWAVQLAAHFSDGGAGTNVTGAVLGVDFLWGETQTAVYAAIGHMETSARKEHGASRGEGIWLGGKLGRTFASGLRFEGQLRGGIYSAERSRTAELAQSISRIETDETVYALSGALRSGWMGTLGESDVEFFPHVLMTGTVLRTPTLTESGTGALSIRRSFLHSAAAGAGLTVNVPAPSQFSDYAWNWSFSIEWTRELTERAGNVSFGLAGAAGETARSIDWPERNRLAGSVSLELLRKSGFSAALRLDGETMGSAHSAGAASAELHWTW